jgi:hypothetical protein
MSDIATPSLDEMHTEAEFLYGRTEDLRHARYSEDLALYKAALYRVALEFLAVFDTATHSKRYTHAECLKMLPIARALAELAQELFAAKDEAW